MVGGRGGGGIVAIGRAKRGRAAGRVIVQVVRIGGGITVAIAVARTSGQSTLGVWTVVIIIRNVVDIIIARRLIRVVAAILRRLALLLLVDFAP